MPLNGLLEVVRQLVAWHFRVSRQRQQVNVNRVSVRGGKGR